MASIPSNPARDSGFAPPPEEVGAMYDETGELLEMVQGRTALHVGMFVPPGNTKPLAGLPDLIDAAQDRQTDYLIGATELAADGHLLDIGCGTGGPAVRLARSSGGRVTGITVSKTQVDRCRERALAAGLTGRVAFQYGDAMAMGFPDATFDAAWAVDCLCHMRDRAAALAEAYRVLKPGGPLLLTEFTLRGTPPEEQLAAFTRMWSSGVPRTLPEVLGEVHEAGFRTSEVLDLTSNMRVSGELMGVIFEDRRAEIEERFGAEATERAGVLMEPFRAFCQGHLEYHLWKLRKPEAPA
ncbi:27-O-demethylrifamycin SV methyltransferase [Streptomyces albiaxialis]|uniref:27-O-demethylrifamycin SV methyltransferase n=1 Tax=Streptomyces albiaxialis TaxID=329523 RepID=A0ABN2WK24_9ACTN